MPECAPADAATATAIAKAAKNRKIIKKVSFATSVSALL
jgi:hypothetical protein